MPTSDGTQLLAGEAGISHMAKGNEVSLSLGQAFDVTVERKQLSFKKIGKNSVEITWQMAVKNGKDKPQKIKLHDTIPGQWKVLKAEPKYNRVDSGTIEFNLGSVQPSKGGKGTIITYTVQVTY